MTKLRIKHKQPNPGFRETETCLVELGDSEQQYSELREYSYAWPWVRSLTSIRAYPLQPISNPQGA